MRKEILKSIGIFLFAIMFSFGGVVAEEIEETEHEVDFEQEVVDEEEVDFEEPDEMYPTIDEETDFEMPEEDPVEAVDEDEMEVEDEEEMATWVIVAILVVVALGGIIYLVTGRK